VRPAGVHDDRAAADDVGVRESGGERAELVVRDRKQQQLSRRGDLIGRLDRGTGKQSLGASLAGLRHGRDSDDAMTGTPEGGAEHSADPTGTDHADRKPSRAISREVNGHRGWFQSSSWVPDEPRVRRTVAGVGDGDGWRTWHAAMADSLYGPGGFYRSSGAPARHFRTAAHVGGPWTAAIHRLAMRVERALGFPTDFTVLDVGADGGELLAKLADLAPAHWSLTGVDVAPRPARLPERVDWRNDSPMGQPGRYGGASSR